MKKLFLPCILIFVFFIMLGDSQSTFAGALNGLNLWLFTVLPSLLPYMIISSYMTENGTFKYLSKILSPATKHIFHLSENCGYVILLGFFCGYPIGSKLSADLVKKQQISKTEGQILLSFCNNVSPAFIITYLIHNVMNITESGYFYLFTLMMIPLTFGVILSRIFCRHEPLNKPTITTAPEKHSIDYCIINSFENIFKLGGYIIIFSILNEFICYYINTSPEIISRICSLTEITSGLNLYCTQNISFSTKLVECSALTAFGGFCCLAQTYSMIRGSGLKLSLYFLSKLIIALITYLIFSIIY